MLHAQDCIAARAAARVRAAGAPVSVVRTVHHVDDFTTPALVSCQREAIIEPDRVLVVSEYWRRVLHDHYATEATVVPNGVDPDRFPPITPERRAEMRARVGASSDQGDRFLFLAVGGVEPRKGTHHAFEALGRAGPRDGAPADARRRRRALVPGLRALPRGRARRAPRPRPHPRRGRRPARHASATTTSAPGTAARTPCASRRSRRAGGWPCSRRWPPACPSSRATSRCSASTCSTTTTPCCRARATARPSPPR